ncbi:MAG: hypothetical protein ABL986_02515 [Vicinamibacterales bacterium]
MDAQVSVLHDVHIEETGPNNLAVLCTTPGVRGEEMTVRIGPSDGVQSTLVGRTVGSEPRMVDGRVMHRIQLAVTGAPTMPRVGAAGSGRSTERHAAMFVRRHAARVVNLSRGGCLLELPSCMHAGTVATLYAGKDLAHAEPIRVGFVHERKGSSWPFVAGAEFLSLDAPSSDSLRSMAGRIELEHRHF